MNVSLIESISKLLQSNPSEVKALTKLVGLNVLKSLGDNKYTIAIDDKTLTAQSQKNLAIGGSYWAKLSYTSNTPELSLPTKQPQLLKNINQYKHSSLNIDDIKTILSTKEGIQNYKTNLLEQLGHTTNKDEFANISTLLLSLHHQVFTVVFEYHNCFSILQLKKRYNNKTKKSAIDFYAALEFLGPIGGVIYMDEDRVMIDISVAYERSKHFLEQNIDSLSYHINISLLESIQPLYDSASNSLLDVSI